MTNTYDASSIGILEGLEAVRKRPGMYIGDTGSAGLHHLVQEIIDNSIDEYLAGYGTEIKIIFHGNNSITIEDNGRGIPVDIHPKAKIPAVRVIHTILHAGGKFDNEAYKVSGGLHGVGASVVNALSEYMEVEVSRDGKVYLEKYQNGGQPVTKLYDGKLRAIGKTTKTGTRTTFKPDPKIFGELNFKWENIVKKVRELSFLCPRLRFNIENIETGSQLEFYSEKGLEDFILYTLTDKSPLHKIINFSGEKNGVTCDVALVYTDSFNENIFSFANNISTSNGGTHETGFKTALTRIINKLCRENSLLKEKDENFRGEDVREGLLAILNVKIPQPEFEGQTKNKLGNKEVEAIIAEIVGPKLELFLDQNPEALKIIANKSQLAQKTREARKKAEEITRSASNKNNVIGITKLAACQGRKPADLELYLVEGDSAGGSTKQGRDRKYQAVLPLKGKNLNVEKKGLDKILNNAEFQMLIAAIGTGIGPEFNKAGLKYHKIIIATDADYDGSHIRTLLLTFFFRYMKELILEGNIYIAQPPLYKVNYKTAVKYAYNDKELKEILSASRAKANVQRFKGLGEMSAQQLWETTMDPKTRTLKQVTINDAIEADQITVTLMGEDVARRREFIEKNAHLANLDF